MLVKQLSLLLTVLLTGINLQAQNPKEEGLKAITQTAVEGQLEFLSSDWMEGRATGTRGAYMSADYIASMFKVYGLEPGGELKTNMPSRRERMAGAEITEYRSYFQTFQLIEYSPGEVQELKLSKCSGDGILTLPFQHKVDFSVDPGASPMEGTAGVVFVGYGIRDEDKGHNDFGRVRTENKIILRLSGFPGSADPNSDAYKTFNPTQDRWAEWRIGRSKNEAAEESGALAVLEIDLNQNPLSAFAENDRFRYNTDLYEGDGPLPGYYDTRMTLPGDTFTGRVPVFRISMRAAKEILGKSGIDLKTFQEESKNPGFHDTRELKDVKIAFKTSVDARVINARNVIGVLEGKNTGECIVVGAHYDHLGKHGGYIWNGADDNASGTVGIMTIAKACMATGVKPEKTIIFAAWTGEEKGLWGSKYYADHPWRDKKTLLNLNLDMISRDDADDEKKNKVSMSYTSSFPMIEKFTSLNRDTYDLNLDVRFRPSETARGGSDHAPFAEKGIPYFYFMAGFPPEYHQPDDHVELVNFPKMTDIIRLCYLNVWDFANLDDWME